MSVVSYQLSFRLAGGVNLTLIYPILPHSCVLFQVDPSCSYNNIVSVVGYQPSFRLAGGVNLPKIITCRCSDGVDRRQLVKVSGVGIFLTCKVYGGNAWILFPAFSLFLFFCFSADQPACNDVETVTLYVKIKPRWLSKLRWLWVSITARSLQAFCEWVESESMGNAGSKHTNG